MSQENQNNKTGAVDMSLRSQRRRRILYIWVLIALSTLLVAASYTWFSISQRPRVSDMAMYINAPAGLELAPRYNSEEWVQQLDFAELTGETSVLKPVTWSNMQRRFFAANYGSDGRMTGRWDELNDTANANRAGGQGYYTMCTFYMRSDVDMEVSLTKATAINDDLAGHGTYVVGMPVWDSEEVAHQDGGSGAQYAIRVGIRVTPVDPETGQPNGNQEFFIYEPNCDRHVVQSEGEEESGITTEVAEEYEPTASIDENAVYIDNAHLIRQTTSTWSESEPAQRIAVIYNMGDFLTSTRLFDIKEGEMRRLEVYVWLEGQDVDCTNAIGNEARIFASIQFNGEDQHSGGLVPIPGT